MLSRKKILVPTIIAAILIGVSGALLIVAVNQDAEDENVATYDELSVSPNLDHSAETQGNNRAPAAPHELNVSTGSASGERRDLPSLAGSSFPGGGLELPFNTSDIDQQNGEVNPLGVVRFSKDLAEFGHSGIDIPLTQGAPIYAVADGPVVVLKSAGDPWGGQGMFQLLQSASAGEGWVFVYEHVTPVAGIKNGSELKTGDLIATKTPPARFTAHFQLSAAFNNYEFTRGMECWVDSLSTSALTKLNTWWSKYLTDSTMINSWRTNTEEGKFPFRGLLNTAQFPNGPQLCYPPGIDVR